MKTIKVSDELHDFLTNQGMKSESYDQIIKRLLKGIWKVEIKK